MTTTTIIIAIAAALFLLITVVFTLQQVEKSNRERQALAASLKSRNRSFQYLLDGFPEGFLSRDLKQLVCRCLLEGLEQLVKLEPREPQWRQQQQQLQEKLGQLAGLPEQSSYQPLTNPAQVQEVQKLLGSLANVVQKLGEGGRLQPQQSQHYGKQIRRLATRVALDSHVAAAQGAEREGKPRLAEHHYRLALDKMLKDNGDGFFAAQIVNFQQRIAALEHAQAETSASTEADDVWKEFGEETAEWKKKSLYDD
jgi:hypothetical protein